MVILYIITIDQKKLNLQISKSSSISKAESIQANKARELLAKQIPLLGVCNYYRHKMTTGSNPYKPAEIELKWQTEWEKANAFTFNENANRDNGFYVLEMLPYPSGKLHMGHVRNYTAGDVIARLRKMQGYNVLHTIGWDAFGLPAENAAIERGATPQQWTKQNIAQMKEQLKRLGFSYEWSRETSTCEPEYYKHEQAMFIDFFNAGLAYQKESEVNWDPVDQTVLANEQVIDGKGWRSGATVIKKKLKQWFLRISSFSQELLDGLETLDQWPQQVKTMQRNWIGRSEGAQLVFSLTGESISRLTKCLSEGAQGVKLEEISNIEVFSTRPETIFGCSFIAISAHHPIAECLAKNSEEINSFVKECVEENVPTHQETTKKGIFTGLYVSHPMGNKKVSIGTRKLEIPQIEDVPVYIANFVLSTYGSGALFGCPAHDARDLEFAQQYKLPVKKVTNKPIIETAQGKQIEREKKNQSQETQQKSEIKEVMINSLFLDGEEPTRAKEIIMEIFEELKVGEKKINYKLHDWGVSRQRYWGCPIPMVYCQTCGTVPEKKENLPITLPEDIKITASSNPLQKHPTWKNCKCPKCNGNATRETDTFDTFFESSWYFLRYISPHAKEEPFNRKLAESIMPVNEYIGGVEHAILHLMYARFFTRALSKVNYISCKEPFKRLTTQGMVCYRAYQTQEGQWVDPKYVIQKNGMPFHKETMERLQDKGIFKMSKSKKNVVDPDEMISLYGADAIRLFILSNTPIDKNIEWSDKSAQHCLQYLTRIWAIATRGVGNMEPQNNTAKPAEGGTHEDLTQAEKLLLSATHRTIKECTAYMQNFEFNKAISLLYTLTNIIEETNIESASGLKVKRQALETLILLISPIAPHLAEELWSATGKVGLVIEQSWPQYKEELTITEVVNVGVQIDGKVRDVISITPNSTAQQHEEIAMESQKVQRALQGKEVLKIISIPGKIVNIVTKPT